EELVTERILRPLGMDDTRTTLTPSIRTRALAAHSTPRDTMPYWDLEVLAGAGALRSTPADMLKFAEAALRGSGDLPDAIRAAMAPRAQAVSNMMVGLGWHRMPTRTDTIVWHNG